MAVSSIPAFRTAQPAASLSATKAVSGLDRAFDRAAQRIQAQRDTTTAQLSAFGRLQGAVSETQATAKALTDIKPTDAAAGIRKAAGNFVKAYNTANGVAQEIAAAKSAPADNAQARIAGNQLTRAATGDTATNAALRDIGITREANGRLQLDQAKFDAALQSNPDAVREALGRVGQRVEQASTQQLSARGNVGSQMNTLTARARELETRQTEQQAQAETARQSISSQTTALTNRINNLQAAAGIAAYERIFSF